MPVKSGFRPRPKAFTGSRKPFNLAEAQANADSGWPRRTPESDTSQTSQSKSRSAYENVKDKVCGFFKRGPANTPPTPSSDAAREAFPLATETPVRDGEPQLVALEVQEVALTHDLAGAGGFAASRDRDRGAISYLLFLIGWK